MMDRAATYTPASVDADFAAVGFEAGAAGFLSDG